jgi:hypothetical protein
MVAKTLYFKNVTVNGALSLQDGGTAPATGITTTGWQVAKTASGNFNLMAVGTEKTTGFSTTDALLTPTFTAASCWRSESPFTGTFANTNWSLAFQVRAVTAASAQTGRVKVRIWKSTNADGTGATQLTSSILTGTTTAALSTTVSATSTVTWTPGGSIVFNNEYLWVQCEWEIVVASGSNSGDVDFYIESAGAITTPDLLGILDAWNVNDKAATITLSNNDKTATSSASSSGVRSSTSHLNTTTGLLYYVEFLANTIASQCEVGLKQISGQLTGLNFSATVVSTNGNLRRGGTNSGLTIGAFVTGDVICMAWTSLTEKVWFRKNNGLWNNDAAADPATGTNGLDISATFNDNEATHLFGFLGSTSSAVTVRTKLADFTFAGPAGFKSWMDEALVSVSNKDNFFLVM